MKKIWLKIIISIPIIFIGWSASPAEIKAQDYALNFDGSDDFVEAPDNPGLNFADESFSIEAWIYSRTENGTIVSKLNSLSHKGYVLDLNNWQINLGLETDGESFIDAFTFPIQPEQWQHVVAVRDGSDSVKFYVNGQEKTFSVEVNGTVNDLLNDGTLKIGKGGYVSPFNGLIDEVRIYSRALSAAEAQEHYDGVFKDESGLKGLWRFDEGSGNNASDSSGQSNNGSISGAAFAQGRNFVSPQAPIVLGEAFQPMLKIESPGTNTLFSDKMEIKYRATDENDVRGPAQFGLSSDAVSIFYSDNAGKDWKQLVDAMPAVGSWLWNLENVDEGDFYKIKVVVKDRSGEKNEKISEKITIDKTPPIFDVSVEPSFTKGENVLIKIQATEPLADAPEVVVRQKNYSESRVRISGEGVSWQGIYEIKQGYDGTAKISVRGRDLALNTGSLIRKGGVFHVGVNPPPAPIVARPLDNEILASELISLNGKVREDTKALLFLNDEKFGESEPDKEGSFEIENIKLSKTFNKGLNILKIISEDKGGNLSEPVSLSIKFNASPTLEIINPSRPKSILFSTTTLEFLGKDENGDKLTFSLQISDDRGKSWNELADNLKEQTFVWDTREFPDGEYLLKVKANDGFSETEKVSENFLVRNFLPAISFEKEKIIAGKNSADVKGTARLQLGEYARDQKNVVSVEYSIDGGKNWQSALPKDGLFDGVSEEFIVSFIGLSEGMYEVSVRAKDSKGLIGKNKTTLIVDFGPPPAPDVTFPKAESIFGEAEDVNRDKAGVQIKIEGKAEPNNQIIVVEGVSSASLLSVSDNNGNFEMEITLKNHGENNFEIFAIDPAGNKSEKATTLTLIKNNPPDLKILWPKEAGGINHSAEILFEIRDKDLDTITSSSFFYRKIGAERKNPLAKDLPKEGKLSFDAGELEEGNYELFLEATDGVSSNAIVRSFLIDNTQPEIYFSPLEKTGFSKKFILEMRGLAEDDFSGIQYVEYSIDSNNWFKALITRGYGSKSAAFRMKHPFELEDGIYYVTFRATDVAGNVSKLGDGQKIVVDSTPPRIGSYTLSLGPFIFLPEWNSFEFREGSSAKFTISLEEDAQKAILYFADQKIELKKNFGLWEGKIDFSKNKEGKILISAEDLLANKTENREIGAVKVIDKGKVEDSEGNPQEKIKMTIFSYNEKSRSWLAWQAETYGLQNPIFTDRQGGYELILPAGRYQILLEKPGFKRLRSSSFEIANSARFINFNFAIEPRKGLKGFFENLLEKIGKQ